MSPGQADRRAVGRRPRRLPGRQLPAAVDRVERQVPRHRPRLLARRAGHARRVRLPADRLLRPVPGRRPPPGRRRSTSSPRTTASPCATWSRTTTSTTRPTARTTGTARAQPVLELRRRGRDRRPGDPRAAGPAAAQLPRHADAVPGRADAAARRRVSAAPSAATTTPTARTTSITWVDWDAASTSELLAFTAPAVRSCAGTHPVFRRRRFFHGRPVRAAPGTPLRTSPGSPRTGGR